MHPDCSCWPWSGTTPRLHGVNTPLNLRGRVQMDQLQDGVFRAVPGLTAEKAAVTHMNGTWTATLDLAGEVYRAYFDSQEAALEAYHAAGAVT